MANQRCACLQGRWNTIGQFRFLATLRQHNSEGFQCCSLDRDNADPVFSAIVLTQRSCYKLLDERIDTRRQWHEKSESTDCFDSDLARRIGQSFHKRSLKLRHERPKSRTTLDKDESQRFENRNLYICWVSISNNSKQWSCHLDDQRACKELVRSQVDHFTKASSGCFSYSWRTIKNTSLVNWKKWLQSFFDVETRKEKLSISNTTFSSPSITNHTGNDVPHVFNIIHKHFRRNTFR
mmetsp:Transcript_6466/g.18502  ORF Transcript_6466/g.18502 Transcript_6466/m.18502 type:complete len:237 (+) Transcript_6466:772-1482(+)